MKNVGQKIREIRTDKGLSQEAFGRLAGRSKGAVSQWENDITEPDREAVDALERHGVPIREALGASISVSLPTDTSSREPSEDDYALVPQYDARGSCGPGHLNGHVEIKGGLAFKRDWLASLGVHPERAVVIYAAGESMAPTITAGSVVLIDLARTAPRSGKVFAIQVGDEVRIKRLFLGVSGWVLASDNQDKIQYRDEAVAGMDAVHIIGQCVWQGGGL